MTFPTISAGTRANEAIGGYANFVAYCNALAAGVDSVTTTAAGAALKANNLSDLTSASTARTNLGLGTAAVANTGTGAANVILGNDARLTDTRTPTAASIVDAMIATTLSPSKIAGTAAILGTNTFTAQQFIDGSSDQIQLRVQGVAGQFVNTITVENSSASVLASISAAGAGSFTGAAFSGAVMVDGATDVVQLRVQGHSAQSNYVQTWENHAGAVIAYVGAAGGGTVGATTFSGAYFQTNTGAYLYANGATMMALPRTAAQIPFTARGVAAQTGNLFEAQNSSTTVLASITAAGLHRWNSAGNEQSTVGAAGGASALPGTPTKYLKVVDSSGATLVIPAYAA